MNLVQQPPQKPGDDLDGLLRAFFRAQMPQSWPAPPVPRFRASSAGRPASSGRPLIRSRWALAASIGLLLLGSMLLPAGLSRVSKPGDDPAGPFLSSNDIRRAMEKEHQKKALDDKHKAAQESDGNELPDPE